MKKFFILLLLLAGALFTLAQNAITDYNSLPVDTMQLFRQKGQFADSFKRKVFSSAADSDKVWQYYILGGQNTFNNPDTALMYAHKGLELAKKIHFETGEYYSNEIISMNLLFTGNYTGSLSIEFSQYNQLNKTDNNYRIAWHLHDVGIVYLVGGDARTALGYFLHALKTIQAHTLTYPMSAGIILMNTGLAYENLNELDSATLYLHKALALDSLSHYNYGAPLRDLGDIYAKRGKAETAMDLYRKSYYASKYLNPILFDVVQSYNSMADLFEKDGQYDSALFYANKSISEGKDFPTSMIQAYTVLTKVYKNRNAFDSAFKYQELTLNVRDRVFNTDKSKQLQTFLFNEQEHQREIQQKLNEANLKYRSRLNVYMLLGGLIIVLIVAGGLWRRNVYRRKSIELLEKQKEEIQSTLTQLKSTQKQLIQSEKMASLGELTAGIAHEIQNPLNFVNNFSDVNQELLAELKDEIEKGNLDEVKSIANDLIENEQKINHHGKRADAIVKGMLQHSRSSKGVKEPTDINALADEYLRLSYHGLRAKDKNFNADIKTDLDESIGKINMIPQDIGRVLLNLFNNAFYAVNEQKKRNSACYNPTVSVSTKKFDNRIAITVSDNGNGIPKNIIDKIFQPFFTTKPTGEGTGLGLSLSYDIIKAHGGEIKAESKEGEGSEFKISLPVV